MTVVSLEKSDEPKICHIVIMLYARGGSFPNFTLQYTIKPSAMDSMRNTNTSHTVP